MSKSKSKKPQPPPAQGVTPDDGGSPDPYAGWPRPASAPMVRIYLSEEALAGNRRRREAMDSPGSRSLERWDPEACEAPWVVRYPGGRTERHHAIQVRGPVELAYHPGCAREAFLLAREDDLAFGTPEAWAAEARSALERESRP